MGSIPFTLRAEILQDVAIGDQQFRELYGDGLGQDERVTDDRLHVHMADITALEALLNV